MIELKAEFTKRGSTFKQLHKDERLAIYSVTRLNADDGTPYTWYEVFRRLVKEKDLYHQDTYEKYPSDEAFGTWAWSCSNKQCVEKMLKKHFADCDDTNGILRLLD